MQLECPSCHRTVSFVDDRPSFCAYCGQALSNAEPGATVDYHPDAETRSRGQNVPGYDGSIPDVVGGYRLIRALGKGGMGTVYEAEEPASGRRVALKLISPQFATSADAVDRFRQEGRLASMISHPHCVFVLAAD